MHNVFSSGSQRSVQVLESISKVLLSARYGKLLSNDSSKTVGSVFIKHHKPSSCGPVFSGSNPDHAHSHSNMSVTQLTSHIEFFII